jgi:4-amino-4-deoxy-L-arabinose transferase-like glycosyltransferase
MKNQTQPHDQFPDGRYPVFTDMSGTDRPSIFLFIVIVITVFSFRIFGPGDLHKKDQPRTVSYTVDMAVNGRYMLPVDVMGFPATKPPMHNWLTLPFTAWIGVWREWSFKAPTVVASLALLFMVVVMTGDILKRSGLPGHRFIDPLPMAAGAIFLCNTTVFRLCYIARPDMTQALFLVVSWLAATKLLAENSSSRNQISWVILLWSSTACAALTKGPPALLPVIYIAVAGVSQKNITRAFRLTYFPTGAGLAAGCLALWAWAAYQENPGHFVGIMIEREFLERVSGGGNAGWQWSDSFWRMPVYFIGRFAPWSLLFLICVRKVHQEGWTGHVCMPGILWVAIIIVFFSLSGGKRDDYLLPALPVATVIVAWWLGRRIAGHSQHGRQWKRAVLAVSLLFAVGSGFNDVVFSRANKKHYGEHIHTFARECESIIGSNTVVFVKTGYHPLQALMGKNQASIEPSPQELSGATWVIANVTNVPPGMSEVVVSRELPHVSGWNPGILALYHADEYRRKASTNTDP